MSHLAKKLFIAVLFVAAATIARADSYAVGFISYDVTGNDVAQFDITNLTGPNASSPGDPTFPVTTPLSLTNLSLTVDFANGDSETFGSSYFTLSSDDLSFDGTQLSTLSGAPTGLYGAISATLSGDFSSTTLQLNDGSYVTVISEFATTISDPSGLSDGDLAVISATAPEPATWALLDTGLLGLILFAWRSRRRAALSTPMMIGAIAIALTSSAHASSSTVKLSTATSPGSGTAGTGTVNVTGSGFPSGTIPASDVTISIASTCGGVGTTTTATASTQVLGTEYRIGFVIPGALTSGTYYVSVSGGDTAGDTFSSGYSCSTLQVTGGTSSTLKIDTTLPNNWVISNGAITIQFNPQEEPTPSSTESYANINSIVPVGTTDNLVDQTQTWPDGTPKGFYMDLAGFGDNTPQPGYVNTGAYLDWWVTYASSSSNPFTFSEHWVVTPNDMGFHTYFVLSHATTDKTGSVGQVQWVLRSDLSKFTNYYMMNEDLSNPGPVKLGQLPSYSEFFSADPGRDIQCATVDLHGFTDIAPGYGREFADKYDYSGYNYLNFVHGTYGSQYGLWVVMPNNETLVGGPTKQMLLFTGNLDMIEAYSNHLDNELALTYASGVAGSRLFGPFYVRINKFGGSIQTPEDMYADAAAAGTSFTHLYDSEAQLLAAGYVPSTGRGTAQIQITGITGPQKSGWVVLSDPGKNHELSASGMQYWADVSNTGTATISGIVPGTYRLSAYSLGHFGELRQDGVVITANQTTTVPTMSFTPENFGSSVFTIGIPDRSSHEFLHGHDVNGHDDREYWGNWNYWADFMANSGAVIYNATDGPAGSATNDLTRWNYDHPSTFDPGLFGGFYSSGDDKTDGYTYAIPAYVATLTGHSGTNGVSTKIPSWTVNFASPANVGSYSNGYAVLSVALAANETSYTVNLNGHSLSWTPSNAADAFIRSGLSGYTQWAAFQFPATYLNPAGANNTLLLSVGNSAAGDMDDALRLELTNNSAVPTTTGWNDYTFVTSGTTTAANDAVNNQQ